MCKFSIYYIINDLNKNDINKRQKEYNDVRQYYNTNILDLINCYILNYY